MERWTRGIILGGLLAANIGCTTISTQEKIASESIRLTINPAEVAGCQDRGHITGLSPQGFAVLHGGKWLVAEVSKRGANTFLMPPHGLGGGRHLFGSGEAYLCPGPAAKETTK